ncbi:Kelch repeat-containing protein [Flagellimonas lutaonensis]|uniref:Kelch repeats protein n=1 Tax=Flagellimonas lutaonensis TaxID=516051 RepID=A0A0D5YTZ6_9FLAO|nr:kelch repeat-containing protein [Allomuricauda lutaonensis]AKA35333.1 Kelch repeats protein [Allomuricauda lutaonensis]
MRLLKILLVFALLITAYGKGDTPSNFEDDSDSGNEEEVVDNEEGQDDDNQNQDTPPPNNPPSSFSLLRFTNGMENVELVNPEFSWEESIDPDGDTVTYSLLFGMGDMEPTTVIAENLMRTSFLFETTLSRDTFYSWQVIASDTNDATTDSEIYNFTTRPIKVSKLVSEAEFEGRSEHTVLVFDGKLWIIGGVDRFERSDEVWSSEDGINWTKITNNAGFESRGEHASVVFNNKIWVVAGIDNLGNPLNDVWSSEDGLNWTQENADAPFAGRLDHSLTVFNNKLWLIGGEDGTYELDDIWMSKDGVNWELITDDAEFPARYGHSAVVFNDHFYLIGGLNSNQGSGFGALNDVWSSNDGINWQIETVDAEFSPRWSHSTTILNEEIWVIGGLGGGRKNDIWSSKDGINWTQEIPRDDQERFSSRFNHTCTVFNNMIFLIGGNDGSRENDVWTLIP